MASGNLVDVLYGNRAASDPAFVIPGRGTLSTGDALERVDQAAGALALCGVGKGDRVSIRAEKCVDVVLLAHACFKLGAIVHPINNAYTVHETRALLTNSKPALFICDPKELGEFTHIAHSLGIRIEGLADNDGSFFDLMAHAYPSPATIAQPPGGIAALLYTSGTTGNPKGALITHRNLTESAQTLGAAWQLHRKDLLLHALPVCHAHGLLTSINVMLAAGGAICFIQRFSIENLLSELVRCTVIMGIPTYYARLLKAPGLAKAMGAGCRLAISGSAPLPADIAQRFRSATGVEIIERYGSTEAAIVTAVPAGVENRRGWVGWALPGVEVRVANPAGRFSTGARGILETRGHNVFAGYWQNADANSKAVTEDGWFITGDLAEIDGEECVRILGRDNDLIISGGLNVYPREVEEALDRCRGVDTSAVFGIPHPDFGEAVVATIEMDVSKSFDEYECITQLKRELAAYKVPKRIIPVASIERNEMGKISKAVLRNQYQTLFAAKE